MNPRELFLAHLPTPNRNLIESPTPPNIETVLEAITQATVEDLKTLLSAIAKRKTRLVRSELMKLLQKDGMVITEVVSTTRNGAPSTRTETVEKIVMLCKRSRHTLLAAFLEAVASTTVKQMMGLMIDICDRRLIDRILTSDIHGNCKWAFIESAIDRYTREEKHDLVRSLIEKHEHSIVELLNTVHYLPPIPVIIYLIQEGGMDINNACAELLARALYSCSEAMLWCGPSRAQRRVRNETYRGKLLTELAVVTETPLANFLSALAALEKGGDFLIDLWRSGVFPESVFKPVAEWILLHTSTPRCSTRFAFDFIDSLRASRGCDNSYLRNLVRRLPPWRLAEAAINWCRTTEDADIFVVISCQLKDLLLSNHDPSSLELYTNTVSTLALRGWNCDELMPLISVRNPLAHFSGLVTVHSLAAMQGGQSSKHENRGPLHEELTLSVHARNSAGKSWLLSAPPVVPCTSREDAEKAVMCLVELYGEKYAPWFARRCLSAALVARDGEPPFGVLKYSDVNVEGTLVSVVVHADTPWMTIAADLLADRHPSSPVWWSAVVRGLRHFVAEDSTGMKHWATQVFGGASLESSLECLASTAIRSSNQSIAEHAASVIYLVYRALMHCDCDHEPDRIRDRRKFITLLIQEVAKTASAATLARLFDSAVLLGPSCSNLKCISEAITTAQKSSVGIRYPCLCGTKHRRARQLMIERLLQWTGDLLCQASQQVDDSNYISQDAVSVVEGAFRKVLMATSILEMYFQPPRIERLSSMIQLLRGLVSSAATVYLSLPPENLSVKKIIINFLTDVEDRASRVPCNIEGGRHVLKVVNAFRETTNSVLSRMRNDRTRMLQHSQSTRHHKRRRSNDAAINSTAAQKR